MDCSGQLFWPRSGECLSRVPELRRRRVRFAADGHFPYPLNGWGSDLGSERCTPIVPAAFTQGAFVSVGPDHTVYVFWLDRSTLPARILIRKSTDLGVTFGSTIMVATL